VKSLTGQMTQLRQELEHVRLSAPVTKDHNLTDHVDAALGEWE
jgi:hypothetical protein